jgi:aspartate/methionine/tyrosine aminotransferase
MFSSRLQWDLRPNALTRLLAGKRSAGAQILDLTESNPTRAGLVYPPGIVRAFDDPRVLVYEPAPSGSRDAREAVGEYYAARGHAVDTGRVLLTASTSEAYSYLFKLLANPGDHVLAPRPSYPLFEFLAHMEAIEIRQYALRYHGAWSIDMHTLRDAMDSHTRAIVVVNPSNPAGCYVKRAELEELVSLCRNRNIALISDEVFSDYEFAPDPDRVATIAGVDGCLAFCMSGLSKVAGLPQMKLGWIVGNQPDALEKLEWIADTYLSVSTPVQCAAARLMRAGESVQRQIRDRTAANLAFARGVMQGSAADLLNVEGGWYIIIRMPRTRSEEEWALELLSQHDVLVQPGFFYDFEFEAFLVISLLTPPDIFRTGMERLRQLV